MDSGKALGLAYGKETLFAADPHRGPGIVREGCLEEAEKELRLKGSNNCTGRERKKMSSAPGKSAEKLPAQQ